MKETHKSIEFLRATFYNVIIFKVNANSHGRSMPWATGSKGLVLAGGGAKGAYQVGAYQALQEVGWQPDIITGTSVGCLNGVLFVLGKVREAVDLWKSWDIHGVLEVPQSLDAEGLRSLPARCGARRRAGPGTARRNHRPLSR